MEALKGMLLEQFAEIETVTAFDALDDFRIQLREGTSITQSTKLIGDYLRRFILDYGSPQTIYNFHIICGGKLLIILRYPGPEINPVQSETT